MDIKIEKEVPFPKKLFSSRAECPYPLSEMEVNDSFLVPNPDNLSINQLRNQVNSRINYHSKHLQDKRKFSIRQIEDGLRVWRVK